MHTQLKKEKQNLLEEHQGIYYHLYIYLFIYNQKFRFVGAIKQRSHKNPLVLCSGDIWSPSLSKNIEVIDNFIEY